MKAPQYRVLPLGLFLCCRTLGWFDSSPLHFHIAIAAREGNHVARIRSIKPEFWQDELVGSLPRDARLLFIGLWSIADDAGRFRANPKFIRAQLFPYDTDVDVEACLRCLEGAGRIQRYESDGQAFGWVRHFNDHQRIEKPKASTLPAPPKTKAGIHPRPIQDESATHPGRNGVEGSGVEWKGEEPAKTPSAPADLPESDFDVPGLQALWNEAAHSSLPRWQETSKKRSATAKARLREKPGRVYWEKVILRVNASTFCRGENDKGWRASPDWILQPDVCAKVLEGKYDRSWAAVGGRAAEHLKNWDDVPAGNDSNEVFEVAL